MQWVDKILDSVKNFSTYGTTIDFGDMLEILIIALLLYYILVQQEMPER